MIVAVPATRQGKGGGPYWVASPGETFLVGTKSRHALLGVVSGRLVGALDMFPYFCQYRNMLNALAKKNSESIAKYADMFSAMGVEPRLRIMQLLLTAHPDGLVVGEIQQELDIPNSTLSHHLDKLRNEGLVKVQRESTFLRYTADTDALQQLLGFLYAECCTRNKALKPEEVLQCCR